MSEGNWISELEAEAVNRRVQAIEEYRLLVAKSQPSKTERMRITALLTELGRTPENLRRDAAIAQELEQAEQLAAQADTRKAELAKLVAQTDAELAKLVKQREGIDAAEQELTWKVESLKAHHRVALDAASRANQLQSEWARSHGIAQSEDEPAPHKAFSGNAAWPKVDRCASPR